MGTKTSLPTRSGAGILGAKFATRSRSVRDQSPRHRAPEPEQAAPITLQSDPIAEIVQGLKLDATFLQGARPDGDHQRPDLFQGPATAARCQATPASLPRPLFVVNVLPAKVILRGGNTNTCWVIPTSSADGRTTGARPGEPPQVADFIALGPTKQLR